MMILLLVAWDVQACQGKFSLHYAAIYEEIFEFHQLQHLMEKPHKDMESKCCTTTVMIVSETSRWLTDIIVSIVH